MNKRQFSYLKLFFKMFILTFFYMYAWRKKSLANIPKSKVEVYAYWLWGRRWNSSQQAEEDILRQKGSWRRAGISQVVILFRHWNTLSFLFEKIMNIPQVRVSLSQNLQLMINSISWIWCMVWNGVWKCQQLILS